MYWKALKKDLKRKKTMNVILFAFSVLSALFIVSSINTFIMTNRALTKFAEMSGTADYYMYAAGDADVGGWARESAWVTGYEESRFLRLHKGDIWVNGNIYWNDTKEPLLAMPGKNYNHVFDEDNNMITSVNDGECCIPRAAADRNDVTAGDILEVTIGATSRSLTVAHITKDYAFGSEYMKFDQILVGENDYEAFVAEEERMSFRLLCFDTINMNQHIDEMDQSILVLAQWPGNKFAEGYYLENSILQAIPIISILLIVISFGLFRFSIRAVIEGDYREIGVMKAIGVGNSGVRKVYSFKYLAISLSGTAIGAVLSLPIGNLLGNLMTEKLRQNIVMNANDQPWVTVICAVVIFMITTLFIRLASDRIKRISPIQAIRRSSYDGRSGHKRRLHLRGNRHKGMPAPLFMAYNDIRSSLRGYAIIFIAMEAGLLLTILSYNVLTTITDDKRMLPYLGIGSGDAYANIAELYSVDNGMYDYSMVIDYMESLESRCRDNDVSIKANGKILFTTKVYNVNESDSITVMAWKQTTNEASEVIYLKGIPPVLPNEIAITELLMKRLSVRIGDTIHMCFGEEDKEYMITASFELLRNTSDGVILSPGVYPDMNFCSGLNYLGLTFDNHSDINGQIIKLKEALPELDIISSEEIMYQLMGNTIDSVNWMVGICVVIGLTTTLLVVSLISHTLLTQDRGAIALLKSMGFSVWSLRIWQTARIAITALSSVLFAVTLSFPLNPMMSRMIFGAIGAEKLPLTIRLPYVIGLFPGILVFIAVVTAWLVSRGVKRIDTRKVRAS
ncbi:MAG: ABC transporter permease [Peptococcaceae bacterium]|nr:ABC transporter permease [Peptococcaceae bacterium]